jgi:aerobic C4-dicarboxylate transport protein
MNQGVESRAKRPFYANLTVQVLSAIALGIAVGHWAPETGAAMKPLGDGFIKLIRMVIGPVVFLTIVAGIAHAGDMRRVGRIGVKALVYFEVMTTLCLLIGLAVGYVIQPGLGVTIASHGTAELQQYLKPQSTSFADFLLTLVPDNAVAAFARGELLQVLIFAVLFGAGLAALGERGRQFAGLLDEISAVLFRVIAIIMRLAPVGAFGAMAFTIGRYGLEALVPLAKLMSCVYLTMALFVLAVLGPVLRLVGFSIFKLLRYLKDELLLVLGTSSTETVLPQVMAKLEALGCSKTVVGLVVPTGYSFNQDGTSIYLSLSVLFIAQAFVVPLGLGQLGQLLIVLMVTSKGAAGVTGSGFIILAGAVSASGILPVEGLALLLGVERFMSEARALTNLIGNAVATLVVARSETGAAWRAEVPAALAPAPVPNR